MSIRHPVYSALLGIKMVSPETGVYLAKRGLGNWVENNRSFYWKAAEVKKLAEGDALDLYVYLTREYD